jgi:hypothetical protein
MTNTEKVGPSAPPCVWTAISLPEASTSEIVAPFMFEMTWPSPFREFGHDSGSPSTSRTVSISIVSPWTRRVRRPAPDCALEIRPVANSLRHNRATACSASPRAVTKDQKPMAPASVEKYLRSKFGESLPEVRSAMKKLAQSRGPDALVNEVFQLYVAFRPVVPTGESGWGAKGKLSLKKIQELAAQ